MSDRSRWWVLALVAAVVTWSVIGVALLIQGRPS